MKDLKNDWLSTIFYFFSYKVSASKYESKGKTKFSIMRDKLFKKGGEGRALLISNIHFIESFMGGIYQS
jgi:hypothetical protein